MNCPPHHWMLEEPNGTSYVGAACRKCGETKMMRAGFTGDTVAGGWGNYNDILLTRNPPAPKKPVREKKPSPEVRHGTRYCYQVRGCRLPECKAANKAVQQRQREKSRARLAEARKAP